MTTTQQQIGLAQSSTSTISTATTSADSTDISFTDVEDADFSSSDDEAGVFFGAHKPFEQKIVAALSKSIPSSPANHDLSRAAGPRRSSLINRVRKRDSREFLRRKTLLLPGTPQRQDDKVWEGGFYEKDDTGDFEPEAGPSSRVQLQAEQVVANLHSLHIRSLDSFTSSEFSESSLGDTLSSPIPDQDEEEEDKENVMAVEAYQDDENEDDEYVPLPRESVSAPMSFGFGGDQFDEHDLSLPLDMGGLSIFDIDDPEVALSEQGNNTEGAANMREPDNLIDITYQQMSTEEAMGTAASDPEGLLSDPFDSPFCSCPPRRASARSNQATDDRPLIAFSSPTVPMETPSKDADASDTSFVSDMNSPVGRAPVVIPVWTSPVKMASPVQALQDGLFSDDFGMPEQVAEATVALPSLESPLKSTPLPPSHTPGRAVPWSLTSPSTTRAGSAVTPQVKRDFDALLSMSQRPVKTLQAVSKEPPPSAQQLKVSQRAEARSQTARGQLDAIYSGSRFAGMGPSSRTALTASNNGPTRPGSSSSSLTRPTTSSAARANARPASTSGSTSSRSRRPVNENVPTRATVERQRTVGVAGKGVSAMSKPATARPTAKTAATAETRKSAIPASKLHAPRPVHARSALPTPLASGLPRPALRRPMAPPSSVPNNVKFTEPPLKTPIPRPANEPVASSLKRPFSATQPIPSRSAASGGPTRPALGLPSRPTRDLPAGGIGSTASGHSQIPTRSPRASARSPARSLLGKPTRGATTPTPLRVFSSAQRGAPTPQRALGSPTRGQKGLSTPSRSPLTALRPIAVQTNRALSPTKQSPTKLPSLGLPVKIQSPMKAAPVHVVQSLPAAEESEPATEEAASDESTPKQDDDKAATSEQKSSDSENNELAPSSETKTNGDVETSSSEAKPSTPPPSAEPERRTSPRTSPRKREVSSPDKDARRSKRATRTPARLTEEPPAPTRTTKPPAPSIVPGMSEKELKAATQRNTVRNQVYLCSIDRQIVRVEGPRPPSPTSKIRTTAEKEEEERKAGRGARAKRRQRTSQGESDWSDDAPVKVEVDRAPGDEDDYRPARPTKRAKIDGKCVHWNRALTVIRGGLGERDRDCDHTPEESAPSKLGPKPTATPAKPAVREEARYPLDCHGNAVERPVERLKRTTVVVRAVFYDGEEPVPFDYGPSKRKKRS